MRCSGALPVCSGVWWIGCASGRAGSVTRWFLERKERSHVNSQAYRRYVSPRFRASHGLSGRGQTSLRCGRSSRDELVQVIRVRLQGNADECSGRSSQYIYIYIYISQSTTTYYDLVLPRYQHFCIRYQYQRFSVPISVPKQNTKTC